MDKESSTPGDFDIDEYMKFANKTHGELEKITIEQVERYLDDHRPPSIQQSGIFDNLFHMVKVCSNHVNLRIEEVEMLFSSITPVVATLASHYSTLSEEHGREKAKLYIRAKYAIITERNKKEGEGIVSQEKNFYRVITE